MKSSDIPQDAICRATIGGEISVQRDI